MPPSSPLISRRLRATLPAGKNSCEQDGNNFKNFASSYVRKNLLMTARLRPAGSGARVTHLIKRREQKNLVNEKIGLKKLEVNPQIRLTEMPLFTLA